MSVRPQPTPTLTFHYALTLAFHYALTLTFHYALALTFHYALIAFTSLLALISLSSPAASQEPLRVVLILEVVHALRADRIAPLGRRSQVVLQAERAEQLLEASDVGVAASCWLGRGGKFYRSPR